LIHLLTCARQIQLEHIDIGVSAPQGEGLFSGAAIREALKEVSKVRLEQTIYAEHPRLREFISRLESEKATQTVDTLATLWDTDAATTAKTAEELVQLGLFERISAKQAVESLLSGT
jgi:Fic family protein